MRPLFMCLALLVVTAMPGSAQDCNALLAHGLRNVEVQYSSSAALATKYYRNCGMTFKDLNDTILANVEVEIFGQGKGGGGFSRAQREQDLHNWCITNHEAAQSAQNQYQQSQPIMAEAVAAWSHCNELASKGVQTRPIISPDQRTVSLNLSYNGAAEGGIEFYGIEAENFLCDTRFPGMSAADLAAALKAGRPIALKPGPAISVICKRNVGKRTVGSQEYTWTDRATIAVRTASDPYQLFFPEETEPPLPEQVAQRIADDLALAKRILPPIGAVLPFALKPNEVAALAPHWLPADGRTVDDQQSPLNGRILPNLNGRVMRGVPADQDASDNTIMEGGSVHVDQAVSLSGKTGDLKITSCQTPNEDDPRNKFPGQNMAVWDTDTRESGCQHIHELVGDGYKLATDLPMPPNRGFIFMVRVR